MDRRSRLALEAVAVDGLWSLEKGARETRRRVVRRGGSRATIDHPSRRVAAFHSAVRVARRGEKARKEGAPSAMLIWPLTLTLPP